MGGCFWFQNDFGICFCKGYFQVLLYVDYVGCSDDVIVGEVLCFGLEDVDGEIKFVQCFIGFEYKLEIVQFLVMRLGCLCKIGVVIEDQGYWSLVY